MVLAGAIVFAGCWYGVYNARSTPALVVLYLGLTTGVVIFLWNMYAYVPLNTRPGCAAWVPAGPTAWATWAPGVCPALRARLHGDLAAGLDPAGHDPGRAAARRPDRDLRGTPAKDWANRHWAAGRVRPRPFPEVSRRPDGITGGPAPPQPASRHTNHDGRPALAKMRAVRGVILVVVGINGAPLASPEARRRTCRASPPRGQRKLRPGRYLLRRQPGRPGRPCGVHDHGYAPGPVAGTAMAGRGVRRSRSSST